MGIFKDKTLDYFTRAKSLYMEKAQEIAHEEGKLRQLLKNAGEKLEKFAHHPKVQPILESLMIFKRMIKAHKSGEFKVSAKSLALIVLGILYFVSPLDIIPDFLPVLGFTDDLSVILAVYHAVKHEVQAFLDWERTKL